MPEESRWNKLDEHHETLRRFVQTQLDTELARKENASDIVQSAMGDAYEARAQYRGNSNGEWYSWLKQIVTNKLRMKRRSLHADKRDIRRERSIDTPAGSDSTVEPLPVSDQGASPSEFVAQQEIGERLRASINQLPPAYAAALRLLYFENLTRGEIAARLGVTEGVVSGNIKRGLEKLEKLLGDRSKEIS